MTDTKLKVVHVFPSKTSFEENQASVAEDDLALVPFDEYVKRVLSDFAERPTWSFTLGRGGDGAFNPTGNVTISGEKHYTSVNIPSGVTVTITKNAIIRCQGAFVNNGTIAGNGTGGEGGKANGGVGEAGLVAGGRGGHGKGNAGGVTSGSLGGNGARFSNPDPYTISTLWGGGGGGGGYCPYKGRNGAPGGNGGAGLVVVAKSITHNGSITLNGSAGGYAGGQNDHGGGGGGGAGGSAFFVAETISNTGSFAAAGGAGGGGYQPSVAGGAGSLYTHIVQGGLWI